MKKLLVVILLGVLYLLLWPVPLEPVAWQPPPAPELVGPYAENNALAKIERLADGVAEGPEDILFDQRGHMYAGFVDGTIRRFNVDGEEPVVIANTGGRPLGMAWADNRTIAVADGDKGLLAVSLEGDVKVLAEEADGLRFAFADDVAVASDSTMYFTDATYKFGGGEFMADILEHGGNGRLLSYHPDTGVVTTLLDGLQFANGVALGPNEEYLLVTESGAYRIVRYWLKGPKQGTHDIFMDNLPGLPDNISFDGEETFWLALFTSRNKMLDAIAGQPWLRKVAYRLPTFVQPKAKQHAFVLGMNAEGEVVHNLQYAAKDAYAPITSVHKQGEALYFGSLTMTAIGRMPAPK